MEEKKSLKISLSTFFLILAIIAIGVMGIFLYKSNNDKNVESQKTKDLQEQVNNLNEKINSISNTVESNDSIENNDVNDNEITTPKSVVETSKKPEVKTNNNTSDIKYEITTRDEIYATIKATQSGNTVTKEFKMNGEIADTGTMKLEVVGDVALVAETGGEYYGVNVYKLVNDKIEKIGTINCGADMVKEATYEVITKGEATAVITAKRNGEKTTKEFKMDAAIARTDVVDILKCGKVVLVAETGGEYYAFRVFRLSQDYTTGKTKGIVEVGRIQQTEVQLEPDNYSEEVAKYEIEQKVIEYLKKERIDVLLDYKVEKVELLGESEKNQLINQFPNEYSKNDYLARVYYSVKPKDINNTNWIAGSGKIEGEWIKNKLTCVVLREGRIDGFGNTSF